MDLYPKFSEKELFVNLNFPDNHEAVKNAADKMILSASGWRKVFGENEESDAAFIKDQDKLIIAAAAAIFFDYIKNRSNNLSPVIAIGIDSRPTGPDAAEAVIRTLISLNCKIQYLYICAAPEIMAYVKQNKEIDGFIYISASHNPKGYNGIKFGPETGAVLGGDDSARLIENFKNLIPDAEKLTKLTKHLNNADKKKLLDIAKEQKKWKKESYNIYLDFNLRIARPDLGFEQNIAEKISAETDIFKNIGIVGDLNGSARCTSIDKGFFKILGINSKFINSVPGMIISPILPEGKNLLLCKIELEKTYNNDNSFIIGYMPDNDGDRGNLVYINSHGKAEILKAQELFALACFAELLFISESGVAKDKKIAIAVNDPTSTIIEKIAQQFGAAVFRAEVGEANVVNLAVKLIKEGWFVRYLGEGSNGGSITLPATVRDPLNTISSIARLLSLKKGESINSILHTLPKFTTTETDDPLAKMVIKTEDHGILKNRYEKIFLSEWEMKKKDLEEKAGITNWEEFNYMQTDAVSGMGSEIRSKRTKGGLKILFKDNQGNEKGFIWMRGSGTEPVFRVMADIEGGNNPLERYLLKWQREIIEKADEAI